MKYLLILLISATTSIISVKGKIPDWIHVCKRNDRDLNKCILQSILDLRGHLIAGIPQLAVPTIDPLHLAKLELNLGPGLNAEGQNLLLKGGSNFEIRDLVVDVEANTYNFVIWIPEIVGTGTYEIDASIASLPIRGKGPLSLTAKSISGRGMMYGKKVVRGGKTYNTFPRMSLKFELDDYDIKLGSFYGGGSTISQVTNRLLREQKSVVIASLLPGFEKALVRHFLLAANNICKNFTWDELFPQS